MLHDELQRFFSGVFANLKYIDRYLNQTRSDNAAEWAFNNGAFHGRCSRSLQNNLTEIEVGNSKTSHVFRITSKLTPSGVQSVNVEYNRKEKIGDEWKTTKQESYTTDDLGKIQAMVDGADRELSFAAKKTIESMKHLLKIMNITPVLDAIKKDAQENILREKEYTVIDVQEAISHQQLDGGKYQVTIKSTIGPNGKQSRIMANYKTNAETTFLFFDSEKPVVLRMYALDTETPRYLILIEINEKQVAYKVVSADQLKETILDLNASQLAKDEIVIQFIQQELKESTVEPESNVEDIMLS